VIPAPGPELGNPEFGKPGSGNSVELIGTTSLIDLIGRSKGIRGRRAFEGAAPIDQIAIYQKVLYGAMPRPAP
jgi:hypothetical protein